MGMCGRKNHAEGYNVSLTWLKDDGKHCACHGTDDVGNDDVRQGH